MINKLTQRHSYDSVEDYKKYVVKCPCCGTILNFGKDDVYVAEDGCLIHHEYIDCPECNEQIMLSDDDARLPYGVKVNHFGAIRELLGIIPAAEIVMVGYDINDYEDSVIEDIKPYLRPMDSMTEEEKKIYNSFNRSTGHRKVWVNRIDYLISRHIDYRGLIPMGLALPATEGMYNK